jgi:hypothetical protein
MLITYDQEVWPTHDARESGMVIETLRQAAGRVIKEYSPEMTDDCAICADSR